MTHIRTKNKSTVKNISKLIFNIFLIFIMIAFIYSLGFLFKDNKYINNRLENREETYSWILYTQNILTTKDNHNIFIQIATSTEDRDMGLSNKNKLNFYTSREEKFLTEGMLFVFDEQGILPFWMKDMNFDIDILWLDENFKVVHIEKNALANSYNKENSNLSTIYKNDENSLAKYVLEINSGLTDILNIQIADNLIFN